jgi:hypothetical protein
VIPVTRPQSYELEILFSVSLSNRWPRGVHDIDSPRVVFVFLIVGLTLRGRCARAVESAEGVQHLEVG